MTIQSAPGGVTEREFQKAVVDLARLRGWKVAHFHDSRRQVRPGVFVGDRDAAGFPDLVLVHRSHGVAYAELKAERGRPSPEQIGWIQAFHVAGQVAYVWRPSNWPEIERFLKDGGPAPVGAGDPGPRDQARSDRAARTLCPGCNPEVCPMPDCTHTEVSA